MNWQILLANPSFLYEILVDSLEQTKDLLITTKPISCCLYFSVSLKTSGGFQWGIEREQLHEIG